jgi:O-acetyl-ADP-ribose deacetylase (regulator of RNase III)
LEGKAIVIEYTSGDILKDDSEALVNTVNCVGVMGRGIALQFKKAWPENFKAYEAACNRQEVRPGTVLVFDTGCLTPPRYIINFPTKRHWRSKSRMEDIEAGLLALVEEIRARHIRSIALPPLGSGLGGLDWPQVRERIAQALAALPAVQVRVYEPKGAPDADKMHPARAVPQMTAGRAALLGLMQRYLQGMLDPFISLLEVHKLMYFMQEAGEQLRLRYVQAPYGPYAENLRHVLHAIEGHYVSGYADGGDAPDKLLTLVPGAVDQADAFLKMHVATHDRFARVSNLVEGFESSFGMELLSTTHWILSRDMPLHCLELVVEKVYAWSPRKRQFTPRQIEIAVDVLTNQGWNVAVEDAANP